MGKGVHHSAAQFLIAADGIHFHRPLAGCRPFQGDDDACLDRQPTRSARPPRPLACPLLPAVAEAFFN